MRTDEIEFQKENKQTNKKKKQARVAKIVLQKFTKELSVISAVTRGCRFRDFL